MERRASEAGCTRVWLITTNDIALYPGAVEDARARLKPEIPRAGEHGIDLRDELQLEKVLAP